MCIHPNAHCKVLEVLVGHASLHSFYGQALDMRLIACMGLHLVTAGRGGLRVEFCGRVGRAADIRLTLAAHALLHLHDLRPQVGHGVLITHILLGLPDLLEGNIQLQTVCNFTYIL